jgi:hypothetical protein
MKRVNYSKVINVFLIIFVLCCVAGCGHMRHAVPKDMESEAYIPGMKDVRVYGDTYNEAFKQDLAKSIEQEGAKDFMKNGSKVYSVLIVSGGAANGAYGAGLLNGWTASGTRPTLRL